MRFGRITMLVAAVAMLVNGALGAAPAHAAIVPWGTVLVPGSQWAGAEASRGDVNVYSNGTGSQDQANVYGLAYECVELAVRWAEIAFGTPHSDWHVAYAWQMWNNGPQMRIPLIQHPNGGADVPQFGDLMVFASTPANPAGHVAVVSGISAGSVTIVEQNWSNYAPTGTAQLPINGTNMPDRWGLPILGWLRSASAPTGWHGDAGPGGYLTNAQGQVYAYGSAPLPTEQTVWPTQATAKAVALIPKTHSGYVLDSYGGLHAFGGAQRLRPSAYWFGQDLARAVALTPDGRGGYVLDGYGQLHPFGTAPPLSAPFGWPGWDIARGLVLRGDGLGGWVIDGWGGMHAFGSVPTARLNSPYYPGQDIARGLCLRGDGDSGWWLDGSNDLHAFGNAPPVMSTADFPGQDVARAIVCLDDGGGFTLTAWGKVRQFGDAPPVWSDAGFVNPIASGLAG